jgi:glucosamine-6-phosphate deaminase
MMPSVAHGSGFKWAGPVRMVTRSENWNLAIYRKAPAASETVADVVSAVIRRKPHAAISFPTGSTPLGMFDILAGRAARGEIDFSSAAVFCLDEYVGVTDEDRNSLTRWLREGFLNRIGIKTDQLYTLPVTAENLVDAAARFEEAIAVRGGLDLAILGLGPNGHVGYNEPGSSAESRTRVIALTPESRSQASAYWEGAVPIPDHAMTMGVGTLLEAKQIVLLVIGEAKASMLRRTLEEPMSADVPASWLRMAGPRLTVIADEAAASNLSVARSEKSVAPDDCGGDGRDRRT